MSQASFEYKIFKASPSTRIYYVYDFALLATGLLCLAFSHKSIAAIILGIITCLFAVWQYCVSRSVLRTHFLVTDEEITSVGPLYSFGMQWDEIVEVIIRERPIVIQITRANRLVILSDQVGRKLLLNTSVLPREHEDYLLNEIRNRVHCPIQKVTDGQVFPSRLKNQEKP